LADLPHYLATGVIRPVPGTVPTTRPVEEYLLGVGLRWQSVIVSPTKLPWMTDAPVPPDPKFAWWSRLRNVNCSYVSSRGESERFMYYDGPSAAMSPVRAWTGGDKLVLEETQPEAADADSRDSSRRPWRAPKYDLLYVQRLGDGGDAAGDANAIVLTPYDEIDKVPHITPARAEAWLLETLTARGLTKDEAGGLLDCWRGPIFKTPGRRVLTVTSGADYNAACPLTVSPPPTQIVRVAIFWSELGPRNPRAAGKAAAP
jgi:hypothetical protein